MQENQIIYKTDLGEVVFGMEQFKGSRKSLEDRIETKLLTVRGRQFLISVVADGMGGGSEGEIAAQTTIDTILDYCEKSAAGDISEMLIGAITAANTKVVSNPALNGSGSTATIVVIQNNTLYVASVGDSRAYLVRNSELHQLTTDHTKGYLALRDGKLKPDEIKKWSKRDDLGIFVGQQSSITVDTRIRYEGKHVASLNLKQGDGIILCSDGLIKARPQSDQPYVYDKEIISTFLKEKPSDAASVLISFAKGRQVDDNVSVVVISIGNVSRPLVLVPSVKSKPVIIFAGIVSLLIIVFFMVIGGTQGFNLPTPTPTIPARSGFAYITKTSGQVLSQTSGGWVSLTQGNYIEVGESSYIKSDLDGIAVLDLNDGSRIFVGPDTGLVLTSVADPATQTRDTVLTLQNGKLIVVVLLRAGNTFSVVTLDGRIAKVDGSIMGVQLEPNRFIVDCFEGHCSIGTNVSSQGLMGEQYSWLDGQVFGEIKSPSRCDEWYTLFGGNEVLTQIGICLPPTPTPTNTPNVEATRACESYIDTHKITPCPP